MIYTGFEATYAAIKTITFSGKSLFILERQCYIQSLHSFAGLLLWIQKGNKELFHTGVSSRNVQITWKEINWDGHKLKVNGKVCYCDKPERTLIRWEKN